MPFLTSLFSQDPPLKLYLGLLYSLLLLITNDKIDSSSFMEQISNFTSLTTEQSEDIVVSDEDGLFFLTNSILSGIVIAYFIIQFLVLGTLRVSEQIHQKDAFWDYFLQKSLFAIFILDVKDLKERLPWFIWYTTLGSVLLLGKLCKDRFEYLTASPSTKKADLIKICILMGFLLIIINFCMAIAAVVEHSSVRKLVLLADASFVMTFVISNIVRLLVLVYDMRANFVWENRAAVMYYGDQVFALLMTMIDLLHHVHLFYVTDSYIIRGWCSMRIHTLVMEIRRRIRRHKNYVLVSQLLERNFAMASAKELRQNNDDCPICWDEMESARKLPCGHLFHNSCLMSWLEQDTSCPKCRTSLKRHPTDLLRVIEDVSGDEEEEFVEPPRVHQRNHLFHFDSSRYTNNPFLSWLPTISIEGFM